MQVRAHISKTDLD